MSTEREVSLQQVTDEELTAQFLDLSNKGRRGTKQFQIIEGEMRARNLLRNESRFSSYSGSRSSRYDSGPMLFSGYSSSYR